ncbi:MAG: MmgE/PrpD family protein [Lautropia sp.]
MTLSARIAAHLANLRIDAVPPSALLASRRIMLDTLAVAWAGSVAPGIPALRRGIAAGDARDATLWGTTSRASVLDCAFLNSAAAGALDYDSLHLQAVVHSDIVLLPAMLAIAERERVEGRRFLAVLTAATDLMCRLGMSTRAHSGWFYTSMHGVFAAAAGCAMLLGLNESGIRDSLGIALFQTGGTQQSMVEKSLTKRLMSAFAARGGLFSAQLAQSGVTAPREAFEGQFGFYAMYERGDPAVVLAGLGEHYLGTGISIKRFPSCGCNHAVIAATLQLVDAHDLAPSDVIEVRAVISQYMNRLVGAPYAPGDNPQVAAQFSVQYSVASAVLHRRLGVAEIQPEAALDPAAIALARKVEVVVDDDRAGQLAPAEVEIRTASRGWLKCRVSELPGSPGSPLSDAERIDKIRECMGLGEEALGRDRIDALVGRVDELENLKDMSMLFKDL